MAGIAGMGGGDARMNPLVFKPWEGVTPRAKRL
jgi:hypothetical protein